MHGANAPLKIARAHKCLRRELVLALCLASPYNGKIGPSQVRDSFRAGAEKGWPAVPALLSLSFSGVSEQQIFDSFVSVHQLYGGLMVKRHGTPSCRHVPR